ncbi:MAG TPA: hypothetical protein VFN57_10890 [Thermomicrobiaceae bacterium]|nr:hypothetical protein [Thermomicrobiaceae bacterium]
MRYIVNFLRFWYDFIVGDDWMVAVGVVAALILTIALARVGALAWIIMPAAVAIVLTVSLWRAIQTSN